MCEVVHILKKKERIETPLIFIFMTPKHAKICSQFLPVTGIYLFSKSSVSFLALYYHERTFPMSSKYSVMIHGVTNPQIVVGTCWDRTATQGLRV